MTSKATIEPVGDTLFLSMKLVNYDSELILPDTMKKKLYQVEHAGPDTDIKPGTYVVPNAKNSGSVNVLGEKYIVTRAQDLLAIVRSS